MTAPADHPLYYLAADVRELDRLAIQEHGIPGFTLMQRAGQAVFDALLAHWPGVQHLTCFCGGGNNGGDGYVIAALASASGLGVEVVAVGDPASLKGDARLASAMAREHQVPVLPLTAFQARNKASRNTKTVIVDALLGTGLTGPARGDYAAAIRLINQSGMPVVAVDIPSGLSSDTGEALGETVKAGLTVTFIGRKLGQIMIDGPQYCGDLIFDDLGVPEEIYSRISPVTP